MKHGIYLFAFCIALVAFSSCRTHKHAVKNQETQQASAIVEKTVEQSTATTETSTGVRVESTLEEWEFIRKTDYDSTGNIRSVQETWRETGRAELAIRNDTSRNISLKHIDSTIDAQTASNEIIVEKYDKTHDARPAKVFLGVCFFLVYGLIVMFCFKIKQLRK